MLSLRNIQTNAVILVLGLVVGIGLTVTVWKPWRNPPAKGRIVLTEPAKRWELPPDFAVTLPPSELEERTEPGPETTVATLLPRTEKDRRRIEEEFSLDLGNDLLLALRDLPPAPHGGSVAVTAVPSGSVDVTVRARPAPWFDAVWAHRATLEYGRLWHGGDPLDMKSYSYEPVTMKLKGRVSLTPVVGYREITETTIEGPYMGARLTVVLGQRKRK